MTWGNLAGRRRSLRRRRFAQPGWRRAKTSGRRLSRWDTIQRPFWSRTAVPRWRTPRLPPCSWPLGPTGNGSKAGPTPEQGYRRAEVPVSWPRSSIVTSIVMTKSFPSNTDRQCLVRTSCTVSRRPQGAARAADSGRRSRAPASLPRSWPLTPVGWRERQRRGRRTPRKSRSRGGFDTGTPRGGSIGLMRPAWEGRPIAGKRTAAAPVSNPPLRLPAAARERPFPSQATAGAVRRFGVKKSLTVNRRTDGRMPDHLRAPTNPAERLTLKRQPGTSN